MSKVSSNYPSYSSSSVSLGGSSANTGLVNGILNSDYDMSDAESAIYNYALNTLANILPSVNTFDTDTLSSIKSQVDAYKNSGIQEINSAYSSDLQNLENDAVSRFGNLDNSVFSDNLSELESERADAVSSFAQNILAKQSELESDELTRRYALIQLLSGLSDDIYNNALNAIQTSLGSSASATDYNTGLYKALAALESTNSGSKSTDALLSSLLGGMTSSGLSSLLTFL